jgi:ribosomal protein S6--L-glutamate ligase
MKIAILVFEQERKELLIGSQMIHDKFIEMGHTVDVLRERELYMMFNGNKDALYWKGKKLPKYDAVVVRPSFSAYPSIHAALIRQFELQGYLVLNPHTGVHRTKNKIRTLQLMHHKKTPMPKTAIVFDAPTIDYLTQEFKYPVILKSAFGAGGSGIFIAESRRSMQSIADYLLKKNEPIKIQEYIAESKGKDIRIFVVGNKVAAAMERSAKKGDFRSNFHKGGSVKAIEVTDAEKKIALRAAKYMGLDIAGVDVLRTKKGPVIIEVNSQPGLEGITKATGVDVAKKIVKYTERCVKARKKNSKKSSAVKRLLKKIPKIEG